MFLIIILGSIVFYSIFLFLSDISSLESHSISFKYEYVFIILIFVVISWIPLFFRWRLLCKNLGLNIPFRVDFLVYVAGFALSITPAKVGELLRTQILRDKSGIQRTQTTPLIFIEKFYDGFMNIVKKSHFTKIILKQNLEDAADLIMIVRKHLDNNQNFITK